MSNSSGSSQYFGKYQGTVVQNVDPEFRGRLQVTVPDVLGPIPSSWAEPCVPLAGPTGLPKGMGVYLVPPVGAGVWVEFQHGDPNLPIWSGCRWGSTADIPMMAKAGNPASPNIVLQTAAGNMLMVSDMPPTPATGGIVLMSTTGAMIVVNDSGIYISNGKGAMITLTANVVTVNQGALVVI